MKIIYLLFLILLNFISTTKATTDPKIETTKNISKINLLHKSVLNSRDNSCAISLIALDNYQLQDHAIFMTTGTCSHEGSINFLPEQATSYLHSFIAFEKNEFLHNKKIETDNQYKIYYDDYSFEIEDRFLLTDEILYATMTGTNITIYHSIHTYQEILKKYGITSPLIISRKSSLTLSSLTDKMVTILSDEKCSRDGEISNILDNHKVEMWNWDNW